MEKTNFYSTFKFYNNRKRRLSAFAREIGENKVEIFIWECDRKDAFTKKVARDSYNRYLAYGANVYGKYITKLTDEGRKKKEVEFFDTHPTIITIDRDGKHVKQAFLDYMEDNYNKAYPIWKMTGYAYLNKAERDEVDYYNNPFHDMSDELHDELNIKL